MYMALFEKLANRFTSEETYSTPQERNLAKLEKIFKVLDESIDKEEFVALLEQLGKAVVAIERKNIDAYTSLQSKFALLIDELKNNSKSSLEDLKRQVNQAFVGDIIANMQREHTDRMKAVDAKMATVKNGDKGDSVQGPPGMDGSPDTPLEIIEKLESVPEKDKLVIEAIRGLRQELDELKKAANKSNANGTIYVGGGTTGGGKTVKVYDLTSQLNGVLKTFALPAFWRVHTVDLSSFPNALRPTVDFTTDAALMTITFTSEINAATSLATGQTCIVTYSE